MGHLFNKTNTRRAWKLLRQNPQRLMSKLAGLRLVQGPLGYADAVMSTRHDPEMLRDPIFVEAFRAGKATGSWNNYEPKWAMYNLCYFAWHASRLQGDFVECGVNKGGGALMVVKYTGFKQFTDRKFYLLDTYNGFVDAYVNEEERQLGAADNPYVECFDYVTALFRDYSNVVLVRGPVPDTLPEVKSEAVAFLSIDMNVVLPEIAATEYFWPKMVSGGVVVLDDYGQGSHRLQKEAFDDFAKAHDTRVLMMPTGQGIIFKP